MDTTTIYYASIKVVGLENGTFAIYLDDSLVNIVDCLGSALAWSREYYETRINNENRKAA